MINYIFGIFIVLGIVYSFISGNINAVNDSLITSGDDAISMIVKMIPLLCLWLGVMKIAEESGLIKKISSLLSKIIHPLFPELKNNSNSISYIATSIATIIITIKSCLSHVCFFRFGYLVRWR